jgi:hypothetical protein
VFVYEGYCLIVFYPGDFFCGKSKKFEGGGVGSE